MQQQVGCADGEGDLVPLAISEAVGEGLRARLAFEAVVVADLLSHTAALQLKVTAAEDERSATVSFFDKLTTNIMCVQGPIQSRLINYSVNILMNDLFLEQNN